MNLFFELLFLRHANVSLQEEMPDRIIGYTAYLIPIIGAYLTG